jgi:hypothetical protein
MKTATAQDEPLRFTHRLPSVHSFPCEVSVAGGDADMVQALMLHALI